MTEKEKAIEDGTIELPTGPAEKKKPHRGRIVVITVAALALLAAGGIAWRTHEDRLMAEARADCAAESERLHVATTAYDALLNGKAFLPVENHSRPSYDFDKRQQADRR